MEKKNLFLIIAFIFCSMLVFAQKKENKSIEIRCQDIINNLRIAHKNDSLAIEIFKKYYQINNMDKADEDSLLNKNYSEIINYFNSEDGKIYSCREKKIEPSFIYLKKTNKDYPLLDDR